MAGLVLSVYNAVSELPSGAANGTMAWIAGSTNRLYISNGTGWYSTTLTNPNAPVISSVTDASANTTPFTLATDGTPTVITVTATDADGTPLTYSYTVTSGTLGTKATISQADNVFTITPSTTEADAGTFGLTFTATDGVQDATSVADFTLAFLGDWWGDRGITFGSTSVSPYDQIDYYDISTQSSASNWGSLGNNMNPYGAVSSGSRIITAGGYYLNPATLGTVNYQGMNVPNYADGTGDGTLGIFIGGVPHGSGQIDVVNMDTLAYSNGVADFSDVWIGTNNTNGYNGAGSNGTRAVYHTGNSTQGLNYMNRLEYITIANISTGTYFGDLSRQTYYCRTGEDMTYIVFASNWNVSTNSTGTSLDKVTTDTVSNATYFGALSSARQGPSGTTNGTYAVFNGAYSSNAMEYFTIQTGGSASGTGSLTWNSDRASSSGSPA